MRIAHLSDLHIGYATGSVKTPEGVSMREQDGYDALAELTTQIVAERPDAIIVGGDIFHTPTPSIRSIIEVQNAFRAFARAGIAVYAVTGNHDTNDIAADISASRVIHDTDRHIYSHAEPYVRYEIADDVYVHMISHHMFSAQSDTMKKVAPVPGAINILTTHGSCIDPILEIRLKANMSPREVVIPDFLLQDFQWDCVMLGHIHERGFVGTPKGSAKFNSVPILYNGSLIRRGFSDEEGDYGRGWTLWTIDEDGHFSYEFRNVYQRPQFDLPIIDGLEVTDITGALVDNVDKVMAPFLGGSIDLAPIVRQKFINLSYAQKSGIDWTAIDKAKKSMFSWQFDAKGREVVEQSATLDDSTGADASHDGDKDSTETEEEVSKMKQARSSNVARDFKKWAGMDSNVSTFVGGLDKKKKNKVISYSEKEVAAAYNESISEEEK